eukprot:6205605-Pleurochrysis_carterae.AAC.2
MVCENFNQTICIPEIRKRHILCKRIRFLRLAATSSRRHCTATGADASPATARRQRQAHTGAAAAARGSRPAIARVPAPAHAALAAQTSFQHVCICYEPIQ